MNATKKFARVAAITAAVALAPLAAQAESTFQTGAGALSGQARLDFRIVIPKILFLQVGTGPVAPAMTANATINLIDFGTVTGANVGDGSIIAATAGSGDLGNGAVTARIVSNGGDVTFNSTTTGALNNGTATETIPYSEIAVATAVLTSAVALPMPAFVATGGTTSTTVAATNRIVNRDARWTFTYRNTTVPAAGTYGGVNTNNGRVTYTASVL
jgi:hypothetical protein